MGNFINVFCPFGKIKANRTKSSINAYVYIRICRFVLYVVIKFLFGHLSRSHTYTRVNAEFKLLEPMLTKQSNNRIQNIGKRKEAFAHAQ